MKWLKPIVLQNDAYSLEPLSIEHHDGLVEAVKDGQLWNLWYAIIPKPDEMMTEIKRKLALQSEDKMLPFVVINKISKRIAGITTYCNIDSTNRRFDIGWTWYAKSQQRTALNTTCKLMLLTHAFETLNCIAVGFRVDTLNYRSQAAVERLGAKFEGTVRNYCFLPNGHIRDMKFYSILPHEWPRIKSHLLSLLEKNSTSS